MMKPAKNYVFELLLTAVFPVWRGCNKITFAATSSPFFRLLAKPVELKQVFLFPNGFFYRKKGVSEFTVHPPSFHVLCLDIYDSANSMGSANNTTAVHPLYDTENQLPKRAKKVSCTVSTCMETFQLSAFACCMEYLGTTTVCREI